MADAQLVKRWTPRDPPEALILCDTLLAEITPRFARAVDRLTEMQLGHSGRPAGTGEPGGGSGFSSTSVVERVVSAVSATERRRLEGLLGFPAELVALTGKVVEGMGGRLLHTPIGASPGQRLVWVSWAVRICIELHQHGVKIPRRPTIALHDRVCSLHDLVVVETTPAKAKESARSIELAADRTETYCTSHLRIGVREPRSDRYSTDGLCRWCGGFLGEQGWLPTLDILEAHEDGRPKVVSALVAAEQRARRKRRRRK